MSAKYNTKHPLRCRSHYPERLTARGLGKTPVMQPIEGSTGLRARQERRVRETCTLSSDHKGHACNGVPWRRENLELVA